MNFDETMRELARLGSEQTRKTYRRHGATDPLFGVSFADLGKLTRQLKTDQALAEQLWATKNTDARTLATMIADPAQFTGALLDAWLSGVSYYLLVDLVASNLAAKGPLAHAAMERWTASRDEWIARAGWVLVSRFATDDETLPDALFEERLTVIEAGIRAAPNRTRAAMNNALIAIGGRNEGLRRKATAAAKRVGKVEVDHGDTACKTPDAVPYIEKIWARKNAREAAKPGEKAAKPAAKATKPGAKAAKPAAKIAKPAKPAKAAAKKTKPAAKAKPAKKARAGK